MDAPNLTKMLGLTSQPAISDSHQPETRTVNTIGATAFIPPLALHIVISIVEAKAEKALPLVLAIHRQLHMTKRETTPLNAAVWKAAGSPSSRERESIMRKLKDLPGIIRLEKDRTTTSHYRVGRGSEWISDKKPIE